MGKNNKKLNILKEDLIKFYIEDKLSLPQIARIYGCTSQSIRIYMVKYDIPRRTDSEANKIRMSARSPEELRKRAIKVRETWYSKSNEERAAINKTRATKPEHLDEAYKKRLTTVKEKQGGTGSKAEDAFYHSLLIKFRSDDICRGYSDERYPFMCDFYIKSLDLFIEYQGHYSHGPTPYNFKDPAHLEYLQKLKQHNVDTYTWTVRDVKKLNTALNSKINLILVYPHNKWYKVSNGNITTSQPNELWSMK